MVFRRRKPERSGTDAFPVDETGRPLRNTALVQAMRNVSVRDAADTRALLFQLLLESTLVVGTATASSENHVRTANTGDTLQVLILADPDGAVLPVFTSTDTLLEWRPEGMSYAALNARALFEMAINGDTAKIAIDPGSATRGTITRSEIEALARNRLPLGDREVVTESTQVRIGPPANPPPTETLAAVTMAMAEDHRVRRAWLYLMQQGDAEPELVVAIRFSPDITGELQKAAMRSVIDRAGRTSDDVRSLVFTCPGDDLESSLIGGAGQEIFQR